MRYCKKRKRESVQLWVNEDDEDEEWEFEAIEEILGPPNGPGPRFVRVKWRGWRDLGTRDGTTDYTVLLVSWSQPNSTLMCGDNEGMCQVMLERIQEGHLYGQH